MHIACIVDCRCHHFTIFVSSHTAKIDAMRLETYARFSMSTRLDLMFGCMFSSDRYLYTTDLELIELFLPCVVICYYGRHHCDWRYNSRSAKAQLAMIRQHDDLVRSLHHQAMQRGYFVV